MPQPSNDNRPAEFDAMLTRLYPRVRNYATRYRNHDADDLAQSAVESACRYWRSHRTGTSMMPWLVGYVMNAARATAPLIANDSALAAMSIAPTQEHAAELDSVLSHFAADERAEVLRLADGGTVKELVASSGMTFKKARLAVEHMRGRMREVAALCADTRRALAA